PRAAARARPARGRGRRARVRERLPRTQDRLHLPRHLLLALRDEERRRRRGRARRHEPRRRRRAHPRDAADAPRRRLPLRPDDAGLQGQPPRRARRDRARAARAAGGARPHPRAAVRPLRRRPRRPGRRHAARARPARRARAPPLRRAHRPGARGRHARRVPAPARGRARVDEHPLPPRAPADVVPRAVPRPAAAPRGRAGGRGGAVAAALARPRRRRHPRRRRRRPARARTPDGMRRAARAGATLVLTGLAAAYLLWKIDVARTVDVLGGTRPGWFLLAVCVMVGTAVPMALRWQWLLRAQGISERLRWLVRAYFVSYAAGQILPTAIGGDAVRIFETSRRHPGRTADIAAIVLLERALGGAGTVLLGAAGFLLAVGRYDVGAYLWLEGAFVLGTIVLLVVFFARSARPWLARAAPLLRPLRLERPLRAFYEGVHHFRGHVRLLVAVFAFTT